MESNDLTLINIVYALADGYKTYYAEWLKNIEVQSIELSFSVPLRNPGTGCVSTIAELAGKIDKIIKINGDVWIPDHKTTSRMPNRDFLKLSPQGDTYILALKEKGIEAKGIIWDYIRKPAIRQKQNETPEGFLERLQKDIGERPDFYYVQFQVQRWDVDIALTQADIWQTHKNLTGCHRDAIWPRYTNACNGMYGTCQFLTLCAEDNELTRQAFNKRGAREFESPELLATDKRRESNSSMNTFRACPRLYYWKYIENLEPSDRKEALYVGTLMHEALDVVYSGKDLREWLAFKKAGEVKREFETETEQEF